MGKYGIERSCLTFRERFSWLEMRCCAYSFQEMQFHATLPIQRRFRANFCLRPQILFFFRVYWLNGGKNNRIFRRKRRQGLLVNFYPSGWFFVCITVIFGVRRLQFLLKTVLSYLQVCSKFHQNLS